MKAILALASSMLIAAYHMLKTRPRLAGPRADHFDRRDKTKLANRLIQRLQELGLPSKSGAA